MPDNYTADQLLKRCQENWPLLADKAGQFTVYLHRVRDRSFDRCSCHIESINITPSEGDILVALRSSPPPHVATPTELQKSLLITSGGLTKLLYQLEERGLISRSVQEQDKRSKLVHLTPQGRKTVEKMMTLAMKDDNEWLREAFSEKELDQMIKLLKKAANYLEG